MQASLDRSRVPLNSELELRLQIEGTQQAAAPDLAIPGFQVQYLGPSTQVSIVNGVVSSSVTHLYTLLPQQQGHFTIPPITVIAGGKSYTTEPIDVDVLPPASRPPSMAPAAEPESEPPSGDLDQALQLELSVEKPRVYVNEPVRGRLQLLVGGVAVRSIEMPALKADGFLVKPIKEPRQSDVVIDGQSHMLLDFDILAVPIRPGTMELGPASMHCQVAMRRRSPRRRSRGLDPFDDSFADSVFDDFFGALRTVPVTIRAKPAIVEVLPLPEEGRPSGFSGAVGRFTLDVQAVPSTVAVGEPVTITMKIEGSGNFGTVNAPTLSGDLSHFKVYDPQPRKAGSEEEAGRRKVFEQVLIPLDTGATQLPAVSLGYFDPQEGRYETAASRPIPITVKPSASPQGVTIVDQVKGAPAPSQQPEVLGRDLIYIKETAGALVPPRLPWYRSAGFWWWLSVPLALLAGSEAWRGYRLRLAADPLAVRASGAMKRAQRQYQSALRLKQEGKVRECYEQIFRTVQRYVGDRFGLHGEGLTKLELEKHLRGRGVEEALVQELGDVFDRCDAERFAPMSVAADQVEATLEAVSSLLKRLERCRPA